MTEFFKLKFYFIFYYFLLLFIITLGIKFIFDFYIMNKNVNIIARKVKENYEKFVIKPRIQIENNGFEYIEADNGYLENDKYTFENVKMVGDFGNAISGKLEIIDNKNILLFTEKPNFIIYLNKI